MSSFGGEADIEISGRAVAVRPFFSAFPATVKLASQRRPRVVRDPRDLCRSRVTGGSKRRTIVSVGARSA
jgi:hypothetical protein